MSRVSHPIMAGILIGVLAVAACADSTTGPRSSAPALGVAPFPAGLATLEWQQTARSLVAASPMSPLAAGRVYAALSKAQYLAITSVDERFASDGELPDTGFQAGGRRRFEAQRAAIAGASVQVLSYFFPAAATSLEQQVITAGKAGAGAVHPQFAYGLAVGREAGDALIDWVSSDGFTTPWTGTIPVGPGLWTANGPPAGANLSGVKPYFLTSAEQFRPAPPPAYLSTEFNADLDEVLTFAQHRTPAQTANAVYWNFGGGTPTPLGYWNEVGAAYIAQHKLDERVAAQILALTHTAMFDALIGCWEAKYYYWVLRPSQANAAITLALGLPNHPSYPSGHSCVSSAAATVLGHYFPERMSELANRVDEAGLSRIVAGIHYRSDITAGNAIGSAVGQLAISTGL